MTAAEQPTLDLGDYRGQNIIQTAVKLANINDGFHPATEMDEPRVFEIGEELTIAVRVVVTDHHNKAIVAKKDDDLSGIELIQTFKCETIALIPDTGATKKALDQIEERRAAAEKAATKAKETAKKAAKPARQPRGAGKLVSIGDSLQEAANAGKIPGTS